MSGTITVITFVVLVQVQLYVPADKYAHIRGSWIAMDYI